MRGDSPPKPSSALRERRAFGVTEVSYGHDSETSWLLPDALDALEWNERRDLSAIALRLGRHAIDRGFDAQHAAYSKPASPLPRPASSKRSGGFRTETLPSPWRLYQSQQTQPIWNDSSARSRSSKTICAIVSTANGALVFTSDWIEYNGGKLAVPTQLRRHP